jgi:hypothetical protein
MSEREEIIEKIQQRHNTIQELSQILLDKLWTDKLCEFQQFPKRFELAALAGGIHSASNELSDLMAGYPNLTDESSEPTRETL